MVVMKNLNLIRRKKSGKFFLHLFISILLYIYYLFNSVHLSVHRVARKLVYQQKIRNLYILE